MKDFNDNLSFLLDWYAANGYKPIPRVAPGDPDDGTFSLYFGDYIGEISHNALYNGYLEELKIPGRELPLVAACISGIRGDQLAEIADHHCVSALSLAATFSTRDKPLRDVDGTIVETFPVFIDCLKAVHASGAERMSLGYHGGYDTSLLTLGLMHLDSDDVWPQTFLIEYQNALASLAEGPPLEFSARMHNFMEWVTAEHHLPHDASGIRYDWFLERSGMLLPVVTRKSLGNFTLWEDLLDMAANMPGNAAIQGLMDYCINDAPVSMRPAIYNGFRSMKIDCVENLDNGDPMIEFMQKHFTGTWLEPLTIDPLLKLNLIGRDRAFSIHIAEHPELFAELQNRSGEHINNLYRSLSAMPPSDFGYEVFSALPYFIRHPKSLDPAFDREAFVAHALNGLDSYLGVENTVLFEDKDKIHEYSIDTCLRLIKSFVDPVTVDYSKFKGVSSRSILLLKQAGLDIKRLPAMNNRDRGRALEMEIGL